MTIQQLAKIYANAFTKGTRNNGQTYLYIENENNVKELTDIIFAAHPIGMLPNDYIYEYVYEALNLISEMEYEDEIEDISIEPDCYNHDLTKWLASHSQRIEYANEAITELGATDIIQALSYGQQREKENILHIVYHQLEKLTEDR